MLVAVAIYSSELVLPCSSAKPLVVVQLYVRSRRVGFEVSLILQLLLYHHCARLGRMSLTRTAHRLNRVARTPHQRYPRW